MAPWPLGAGASGVRGSKGVDLSLRLVPYPMGSSGANGAASNGANAPEPTGLHFRICAPVDWFLRFVGNKRSIQKALSVSLNALFRFELGPSTS